MLEIERKWIIDPQTDLSVLRVEKSIEVEQCYVSAHPEIRVRHLVNNTSDLKYVMSVKTEGNLSREEYEFPIDQKLYDFLAKCKQGSLIKKQRDYVRITNALTAEIDIYHGNLEGLRVVEVEFENELEALAFTPPAWFGREVTEDTSFKNKALAIKGLNNQILE